MTEIELKARLLLQSLPARPGVPLTYDISRAHAVEALCRAIEQHEAFRREVSDAVEAVFAGYHDAPTPWVVMRRKLEPFIIAKPDPLVEALNDMKDGRAGGTTESYAACLRAALAARGLTITETKE